MNYIISNLCLANKIHIVASSIDEVINGELGKIWFENTRVSQKTTQPCFHIGLGSRGRAEPLQYFEWGRLEYPLATPPPQKK